MLPSARRPGEAMRRILVDRVDLDQLIQRFRETAPSYSTDQRDRSLQEHFARRKLRAVDRRGPLSVPPAERADEPPPLGKARGVTKDDVLVTRRSSTWVIARSSLMAATVRP